MIFHRCTIRLGEKIKSLQSSNKIFTWIFLKMNLLIEHTNDFWFFFFKYMYMYIKCIQTKRYICENIVA